MVAVGPEVLDGAGLIVRTEEETLLNTSQPTAANNQMTRPAVVDPKLLQNLVGVKHWVIVLSTVRGKHPKTSSATGEMSFEVHKILLAELVVSTPRADDVGVANGTSHFVLDTWDIVQGPWLRLDVVSSVASNRLPSTAYSVGCGHSVDLIHAAFQPILGCLRELRIKIAPVLEHINHEDIGIVAVKEDYSPLFAGRVPFPVMTSPVVIGKPPTYVLVRGKGYCGRKLVVVFAPKMSWANLLNQVGFMKSPTPAWHCIQVSGMGISRGEGVF